MNGLIAVGYYLFTLFFNLIIFILWCRISLRYCKVSFLNPVSQMIYTLTNPIVKPLTSLMSGKTPLKQYDWPSFCVLILVELTKFLIIGTLFLGSKLPWIFLPLYTLADLIVQPCNLLFYAILIRMILSWINPTWHHPLADVLVKLTEPLLKKGRQVVPPISGFDFSPILILVGLQVITLFINASLPLHIL